MGRGEAILKGWREFEMPHINLSQCRNLYLGFTSEFVSELDQKRRSKGRTNQREREGK